MRSLMTFTALTLAIGLTACTLTYDPKTGEVEVSTEDDGGGEGTSEFDPSSPVLCSTFEEDNGDHLGYGNYPDSTDSSGPECVCSFVADSDGISYNVDGVRLQGSGHVPKGVAAKVPWYENAIMSPVAQDDEWQAQSYAVADGATELGGEYFIRQATVDRRDGSAISCGDYDMTRFSLDIGPSGPPAMPQDDEGTREDALWCMSGERVKGRFQLVQVPGQTSFVPLFIDGDARYAGMEIESVRVADWGDAEHLTLSSGATELELRPGQPARSLPEGGAWLHSARWSSPGLDGTLPVLELEGSCVSTPALRSVAAGYRAEVTEVAPWLDVDAHLVARVVDDASDDSQHLMFEVEGTGFAQGLPLAPIAEGAWSMAFDSEWVSLVGVVEQDSELLRVTIQEGNIGGVGDLSGRSFTLERYAR
ncbi:MAG: hypothetical protein H6741_10790 [Alphaproteobacteria bacterium]|nr:hypothetical protein [Alphaproteobacteria bacterium]MCB9793202.1 hypothetical protein [Alphaproteobacteria bacterium]